MTQAPSIHCCGCRKTVTPRLTNGKEIYPHREDHTAEVNTLSEANLILQTLQYIKESRP